MQSRQMAPVLEIINAIDVTRFVTSVIYSEQAIISTIESLKQNRSYFRSIGWD